MWKTLSAKSANALEYLVARGNARRCITKAPGAVPSGHITIQELQSLVKCWFLQGSGWYYRIIDCFAPLRSIRSGPWSLNSVTSTAVLWARDSMPTSSLEECVDNGTHCCTSSFYDFDFLIYCCNYWHQLLWFQYISMFCSL